MAAAVASTDRVISASPESRARAFRGYTAGMTVAAAAAAVPVVSSGWSLHGRPAAFALLVVCVLAGEFLPIRIPRGDGLSDDLTLSAPFALAVTFVFGPALGVAVYAGACLVAEVARRPGLTKGLFNVVQCIVTMSVAAGVFYAVAGHTTVTTLSGDAVPMIATGAVFLAADNVLTAVAVAIMSGASLLACVGEHVTVHTWTEASLLALAPVVVAATREATWLVPLLLVPVSGILIGGRQAAASWYRALFDDVTGLPNRTLLTRRIDDHLAQARHGEQAVAVAVVAVDDLKAVGDALGAAAADEVAAHIGARLSRIEVDGRTLGRTGPYEYAATALASEREAFFRCVAESVAGAFAEPFCVGELSLTITAHTGVAWAPAHGALATELLARAAAAADRARALAEPLLEAPAQEQQPLDRLILAGQLQRGIANDELMLEYQPKQALREGVDDAVEALVRWNHPELGPLSPQAFVPLAEQSGLIGELTRWVVSAAVRQSRRWRDSGFPVRVAVNVSARDLLDARFVSHVEQELERASLPAGALQLEVTETQLLGEARDAQLAVARLSRAGVSCAIDDFGTGYSSLSQLQRLRVDEIKIDRSFVDDLDEGAADRAIVQATVGLARSLGLSVTAEGVETRAALERLAELGCDYAQGFYVGKPMPADACRARLADAGAAAAKRLRHFTPGLADVGARG